MHRSSSLLLAAACGALAISVGAAACSKPTTTPPPTVDTFLKSYDQALCQFMVRCGQLPDTTSCTTALAPDPTMAQAVSSVVFGSLMFDPTAGQTCLNLFTTASCETAISSGIVQKDIATACGAAFTGKGAMGAPCFDDIECESGGCTPTPGCSGTCCPGTCGATASVVADMQPCIDPKTMAPLPCVTGDYCSMADKKCEAQAQPNATCKEVDACVTGYSCDTGSNLCFKQSATGGTCNPSLKGPCLSIDDYCDAMKMTCVVLPGPGQACVADGVHNGDCAADSTCVMMMCTKLPSVGDMCTSACLGELTCDTKGTMKCAPLSETHTCVD